MTTPRTENQLSDVLRMLMNRAGIQSDNELADRLDAFENGQAGPSISQATISRILNGSTRDPRAETVRRIGKFFGVTESQMRGLDPIERSAIQQPIEESHACSLSETPAAPYFLHPNGEPGARECLALLAHFSRLTATKRKLVTQMAHDLRRRDITPQTPIYTLDAPAPSKPRPRSALSSLTSRSRPSPPVTTLNTYTWKPPPPTPVSTTSRVGRCTVSDERPPASHPPPSGGFFSPI